MSRALLPPVAGHNAGYIFMVEERRGFGIVAIVLTVFLLECSRNNRLSSDFLQWSRG